jgi:formylglycine-generating enzyme required for sulfatase activity
MTADTKPIKVFYSYSHKDRKRRETLGTHLSLLQREGLIQEWHDGCIQAGQEWEPEIYQQLEAAHLILLLISPDFMKSDFCYATEMQRALQRHEAGTARVVPIILRPTDWKSAPFSQLKCLPLDGKPVTTWTNRDEAFLDIVTGIRQTLTELRPTASKSKKSRPPAAPPRPELRTAYLQLMIAEWRTLPLEALDPNAVDATARRLSLEQVYVALDTTTPRSEPGRGKDRESFERLGQEKPLSAVEVLCQAPHGRLVLLGQPGSGKSTFARYLALTLAEALLQPRQAPLKKRLPGWQGEARLPVFVPLRLLAASLPAETSQGTAGQVESFIRNLVDERESLTGFGEPLLAALQESGGLVTFDGLDEVPGQQRLLLKQALSEFAELYPRCTVLVTCRVHSYRQDPAWQLDWAAEHTLAEFNRDKIDHFIDAWYGALAALPGSRIDYLSKAQTLKTALGPDDPRGLRVLAGTPLLLTVMAIVHAQKSLPDSRVGVYRECVDILLMRWQGAKEGKARRPPLLEALGTNVSALKVHQGLREIAYRAHRSGERDRLSGSRALVSDVIIHGVMHKRLGAEGLEIFLDYCRHANGLLLADRVVSGRDSETEALYVFPHLSFEEYLAALHLLQTEGSGIKEAVTRAGDPAWREVIRFLGEYLCHDEQGGNPYLAKALLDALCPAMKTPADDDDWRRVWLAGVLLPGWRREVTEEEQDPVLQGRIIDRLVALLQTPAALRHDPPARAEAGRALAWLGDPRPGVGLREGLPDFQWVRIPGTAAVRTSGRFPNFTGLRLGNGAKPDSEALDNENWSASAEPLELQDFELAVYAVTVAQFRPFVVQGYCEDRWWSEAGRRNRGDQTQPYLWDDPIWTLTNHPVVGVCWYEAEAYCNWLNERLQLKSGTIRLPMEAEWEWAARGPEGRRYPWGDEWESWRCNSEQSGINHTSAVGCFPGSAEDYWWKEILPDSGAVHDLAGNVWEWTASEYAEDYSGANQSVLGANPGGPCVLRGGSWFNEPLWVRGAARDGWDPRNGGVNWGFRLARTFPLRL